MGEKPESLFWNQNRFTAVLFPQVSQKTYRDEKEEPLRDALLKNRDGNCLFN